MMCEPVVLCAREDGATLHMMKTLVLPPNFPKINRAAMWAQMKEEDLMLDRSRVGKAGEEARVLAASEGE
jgi:hypothetical protein